MKLLFHKNKHFPAVNYFTTTGHESCNPLNRMRFNSRNSTVILYKRIHEMTPCFCVKSLYKAKKKVFWFPLVHQEMPFFFLPWPLFFPIRLPFSFLACR